MYDSNISFSNLSSNSSAYEYCIYFYPDTDLMRYTKLTALALLVVSGTFLNGFVIILAAKYTPRKNIHYLIINMTVSDALFLLSRFSYYAIWQFNYKWKVVSSGFFGDILCKSTKLFHHCTPNVSLITLLVINIERFRALGKLQRCRPYTVRKRVAVIGICWLLPMPSAVFYSYLIKMSSSWHCGFSSGDVDNTFGFFVDFDNALPFVLCCVIFVFGILIIVRLSKSQPVILHLNKEQQKNRKLRTKAAVHMVLASLLLFACCWFPYRIYRVLRTINSLIPSVELIDYRACWDYRSFTFIVEDFLPLVNSSFSLCVYIIFLPDFREAAKNVLCTCRREEPLRRNSFELQALPVQDQAIEPERENGNADQNL